MEPDNQWEEFTIIAIPQAWDLEPDKQPECCIYRVPRNLRNVNEDAYTPKEISIGPFHHGKENLKKKEELKLRSFLNACYRTKKTQGELARCVQEKELTIRHCYAENFHEISKEDFVKMILLDSIFIIEHLWWTTRYLEENNIHENVSDIMHDLILLENQVPFSVLEELYNFAYRDLPNHHNEDKSFHKLVLDYFLCFWKDSYLKNVSSNDYSEILRPKHLIDFLRCFLLPSHPERGERIKRRLPCATKLAEAGVEFKENKNKRLLEIKFQKSRLLECLPFLTLSWLSSFLPCFKCLENMEAVLKIPSFTVGDTTNRVIRNFMAFEQCHYPHETYICNYVVLLDHLIKTEKDVDLLVEKKVLDNWLGRDEAVVNLINELCHQIVEGNHSCYHDISERINKHYMGYWSKLMASLKSQYFRDFWRGSITVAGILALFFAFWSFLRPFVSLR